MSPQSRARAKRVEHYRAIERAKYYRNRQRILLQRKLRRCGYDWRGVLPPATNKGGKPRTARRIDTDQAAHA